MRFLESERSGARTTTSGWFTVLIALVGLFLTTMATLSSQRASTSLIAVSLCAFLWALATVSGAAYAWAQYLGAVRSFTKRYLNPSLPLSVDEKEANTHQIDYAELRVRDVGDLFNGLWLQWRERKSFHGVTSPQVLIWANRIRSVSLIGLFAGLGALMSSTLLGLFPGAAPIVVVLFIVASVYAVALGLMIWRLVVNLAKDFEAQRTSDARARSGEAVQK